MKRDLDVLVVTLVEIRQLSVKRLNLTFKLSLPLLNACQQLLDRLFECGDLIPISFFPRFVQRLQFSESKKQCFPLILKLFNFGHKHISFFLILLGRIRELLFQSCNFFSLMIVSLFPHHLPYFFVFFGAFLGDFILFLDYLPYLAQYIFSLFGKKLLLFIHSFQGINYLLFEVFQTEVQKRQGLLCDFVVFRIEVIDEVGQLIDPICSSLPPGLLDSGSVKIFIELIDFSLQRHLRSIAQFMYHFSQSQILFLQILILEGVLFRASLDPFFQFRTFGSVLLQLRNQLQSLLISTAIISPLLVEDHLSIFIHLSPQIFNRFVFLSQDTCILIFYLFDPSFVTFIYDPLLLLQGNNLALQIFYDGLQLKLTNIHHIVSIQQRLKNIRSNMKNNGDMFDQVIQLVNSTNILENQVRQWAEGSLESTGRWSNVTDGLLRRKPSKENLKETKKQILVSHFYTDQKVKFIIENNKGIKSPSNVGTQLQRLQNNLMTSTSKHKNPIERTRQRKIMKRLKGQKENSNLATSLQLTSEHLQRLGEDQRLKEILLTLSRFYDKQKEQNSELQLQLSALSYQVQAAQHSLNQETAKVQAVKANIESFRKEAEQKEIEQLQKIVGSSLH